MSQNLSQNINKKINYFIDYWRDFSSNDGIEEQQVHTIVYSPKELFKAFAEEVIYSQSKCKNNEYQFKRSNYKDFFIKSINEFINLPIQSIDFLQSTLTLIQNLFSKPDFPYLLHILSQIDIFLSDFRLGKECVNELEKILFEQNTNLETKVDINNYFNRKNKGQNNKNKQPILIKDQINILTRLIIFQLREKGHSKRHIQKIPENIFSQYNINNGYYRGKKEDDLVISTKFPYLISMENLSIGDKVYQDKLKTYLDNLTDSDRILAIKNYLIFDTTKQTYIFQLKGFKGAEDLNIQFGNVRIYNPKTTKLIKKYLLDFDDNSEPNKFDDYEYFGGKDDDIYCNGAVTLDVINQVNVIDQEYPKKKAISNLNQVLSFILSNQMDIKYPIKINISSIFIIDENGIQRGFLGQRTEDDYNFEESSEHIKFIHNFYQSKITSELNSVDKQIIESLNWKKKAVESFNVNEKILWFWVSLENLMNDGNNRSSDNIFNYVSKYLAIYQFYDFVWKHYDKLIDIRKQLVFNSFCKNDTEDLKKLDSILWLNKINTKNNRLVYPLKEFIKNIDLIKDLIKANFEKEELLYYQLDYLRLIFNNPDTLKTLLDDFEHICKEKLLYVYRIRNKIVHNANTEENTLSEYYSDFISQASTLTIIQFMTKRYNKNLKTTESILNDILYDFNKLKLDIEIQGITVLYEK
ncbi:hypothetical protein [Cyanobacterium aponinum]|uniref:hypothetical protein n=1 Tax=Cyanobacterium aponinum TaxID=379064 RepID=UPI000C12AC10|nr:hypothetical protein [Cyanobacterium aponinum]PHV61299.1 hypothetical protein CSQ80_16280 [Cyanobacterium aponinum IPPAS B-1201]